MLIHLLLIYYAILCSSNLGLFGSWKRQLSPSLIVCSRTKSKFFAMWTLSFWQSRITLRSGKSRFRSMDSTTSSRARVCLLSPHSLFNIRACTMLSKIYYRGLSLHLSMAFLPSYHKHCIYIHSVTAVFWMIRYIMWEMIVPKAIEKRDIPIFLSSWIEKSSEKCMFEEFILITLNFSLEWGRSTISDSENIWQPMYECISLD